MKGATLGDLGVIAVESADLVVPYDTLTPATEGFAHQLQQDWSFMKPEQQYNAVMAVRNAEPSMGPKSACDSEISLKGSKVGDKYILHLSMFMAMVSPSYERQVISFLLDRTENETVVIYVGLNECPSPSNILYYVSIRTALYACKAKVIFDFGCLVDETVIYLAVAADEIQVGTLGGITIRQIPSVEDIFVAFRHAYDQWLATLKEILDRGWITQSEYEQVMSQDQTVLMIYGQEWLNRVSTSTPADGP